MNDLQQYSSNGNLIWSGLMLLRNAVIGTVSVGLVIGACLFIHFLLRLAQLPKSSREYREMSYHLQSETLLRYMITIVCLLTLNVLFYTFFELGKACTHLGAVVWVVYLVGSWAHRKARPACK